MATKYTRIVCCSSSLRRSSQSDESSGINSSCTLSAVMSGRLFKSIANRISLEVAEVYPVIKDFIVTPHDETLLYLVVSVMAKNSAKIAEEPKFD